MEPDNIGPPPLPLVYAQGGEVNVLRPFEVYYRPQNLNWSTTPRNQERYKTLFPNKYKQLYRLEYIVRNLNNVDRDLIFFSNNQDPYIAGIRRLYNKLVIHYMQNTGGSQWIIEEPEPPEPFLFSSNKASKKKSSKKSRRL